MKVCDVEACNGCPFQKLYPNSVFVPPRLGTSNRLAIGEKPGEEEAAHGEPFYGATGSWLRGKLVAGGKRYGGLYAKAGVDQSTVSYTNVVNCRDCSVEGSGNLFPTDSKARGFISAADAEASVQHCLAAHVAPLIKGREWTRLDIIGDEALWYIVGKSGIVDHRGFIFAPKLLPDKKIAVPTVHPAYIMRGENRYIPVVVSDLKKSLVIPVERHNPFPSLDQVRAFNATEFAFDIENDIPTRMPYMVGLSTGDYQAMCVPVNGVYLDELRRIFRNAKSVLGQNIEMHDLPILEEVVDVKISEACEVHDIMLEQHLLQPALKHNLEFIASIFTNKEKWKDKKGESEEIYCCGDTGVVPPIHSQTHALLKLYHLEDIYEYVSRPLARICYQLRRTGIAINPARVVELRAKFGAELGELEGALPEAMRTQAIATRKRVEAPAGTLGKSGKPVKFLMEASSEQVRPWRSSKRLMQWLYEVEKLPVQLDYETKQPTVAKEAIDKLLNLCVRKKDPRAEWLRALRRISKLNALINNFTKEEYAQGEARRIHPNFHPHGTAFGRLSSSDPNLQNIPEDARYIYVPSQPGWVIWDADFSSIENRLAAYLANDTARLARMSQPGFSEYKYAASVFLGIPMEDVEKDNSKDAPYGKAKRIVQLTDKGGGPRKIANLYDMNESEVRKLQEQWKAEIAPTIAWQQALGNQARKQGYLRNSFGRIAWFPGDQWNESIAFGSQSPAADILIRVMIAFYWNRINWPFEKVQKVAQISEPLPASHRLLVTVHDSLVGEGPIEDLPEVYRVLKKVGEQPWPELGGFHIPMAFSASRNSWGEVESWEPGTEVK